MLVRGDGKRRHETEDVSRGGEKLGHDADALPGHAQPLDDCHHRRAHHAAIEQLIGREALGIAETARGNRTGAERHQIRGRAADVDQQPVADVAGGESGGCMPIGRSDPVGASVRLRRREKVAESVDLQSIGRNARGDGVHHRADTRGAIGKNIGELGGHGDRMARRLRKERPRLIERRLETADPEPQGTGDLPRRGDDAIVAARELQMRAADVPTENDAHVAGTSTATGITASGCMSVRSGRSRRPSTSAAGLTPMLRARPA